LAARDATAPFIAIEGIDGCGKSTVTALVAELLRRQGQTVAVHDFPVYSEPQFGPLVARFLRGEFGDLALAEPWFAGMLFAGNRAAVASSLRADLETGHVVLCDRFTYSNVAFQSAKLPGDADREAFMAWLVGLEFELFRAPRPDVSVWLRVAPALRPAPSADRGHRDYLSGAVDIHESDAALQCRVHEAYEQLASTCEDIETIDCAPEGTMLPPEAIAAAVVARLGETGILPVQGVGC
jgi:dTMP kinase